MYKLTAPNKENKVTCIIRISDGACIPFDPDNVDFQQYQKFLADGGTPLPAESN